MLQKICKVDRDLTKDAVMLGVNSEKKTDVQVNAQYVSDWTLRGAEDL